MSNLSMECISERVNEIKNELKYDKVKMKGFYEDLLKLKGELEEIFDKRFFYLGYGVSDAPYHGWSGEPLKNMRDVDSDIQKKFYEMYAIILKATDSEII